MSRALIAGSLRAACVSTVLALTPAAVSAQSPAPPMHGPVTLKEAFETAWARQPEARAAGARRDAALARRESADSLFAAPPSVVMSAKSDQVSRNRGNREYEAGLEMPLWLPGERARMQALTEAESSAVGSRVLAAQLRIAAAVRTAYWAVQRARVEADVALARLENAQQLAADVTRRVDAGDLARADLHQAQGEVARAEASLSGTRSALAGASQHLRALVGKPIGVEHGSAPEPMPEADDTRHPVLRELTDRTEVARRAKALAAVQKRANPELTIGASREREAFGEPYGQALMVGMRIPFGSDSRSRARAAAAAAEELELEARLAIEKDRVLADIEAARVRVDAVRSQREAAERHARLARESRGFFARSFALGETDLPMRLRIELEAYEAERQVALISVEEALAISQLRQALGLLP